jgi:protein lifeguard
VGALVLAIYIVYDTQMIIGNNDDKFEVDDYIFAAMVLYVDIVRIFIHILKNMGDDDD